MLDGMELVFLLDTNIYAVEVQVNENVAMGITTCFMKNIQKIVSVPEVGIRIFFYEGIN